MLPSPEPPAGTARRGSEGGDAPRMLAVLSSLPILPEPEPPPPTRSRGAPATPGAPGTLARAVAPAGGAGFAAGPTAGVPFCTLPAT